MMWEREKNLKNIKKTVVEFKGRISTEVKRQEKLNLVKKRNFRRKELSRKYIVKTLYQWNNRKFEEKYLRKLEKNQQKQKSVFLKEKP